MRKNSGPNTDPCSAPAPIDNQLEDWPFKTALIRLLWRND